MVLVINDNLYGLMFALSYICRCVHLHLLDLHLLESRLREEKEEEFVLIKARCVLINTQVQVKICRRSASPILVYGGASCESSSPSEAQSRKVVHLEEMKIVFINLKWINAQGKAMILIGFLFYRSHDV